MRHGTYVFGLLMALLFATATPARAQIETLIMPGKVVEAHAEYEEDCTNCHERFERSKQRSLCLDCHEFHMAETDLPEHHADLSRDCLSCHFGHGGQDAFFLKPSETAPSGDEPAGSEPTRERPDAHQPTHEP